MKSYIIMVAGAALLSAFSDMLAPQTWRKYTKIVTGLVILAVLLTPVMKMKDVGIFEDFSFDMQTEEENKQQELVRKELKAKVEEDAEQRMQEEFRTQTEISADIAVNDAGQITGVQRMYVHTDKNEGKIQKRLAEVYGVDEKEVIVGR